MFSNTKHNVVTMLNRNVWNDIKELEKEPKTVKFYSMPPKECGFKAKNTTIFFNGFYTCAVIYDTTHTALNGS